MMKNRIIASLAGLALVSSTVIAVPAMAASPPLIRGRPQAPPAIRVLRAASMIPAQQSGS